MSGSTEEEIRAGRWYLVSSSVDGEGARDRHSGGWRVTALPQVLHKLRLESQAILEVSIPATAGIELDELSHHDGVSSFSLYEGLAVSGIQVEGRYRLNNPAEMDRLVQKGFFENEPDFFHGSNREHYADWLCEKNEVELYRHFAPHFHSLKSRHLTKAASYPSLELFRLLLQHHDPDKAQLDKAVITLAYRGEQGLLQDLHAAGKLCTGREGWESESLDLAYDAAVLAARAEVAAWLEQLGAKPRELNVHLRQVAEIESATPEKVKTQQLPPHLDGSAFVAAYNILPAEPRKAIWPELFRYASRTVDATAMKQRLLEDVARLQMTPAAIEILLSSDDAATLQALNCSDGVIEEAKRQEQDTLQQKQPLAMESEAQELLLEQCCEEERYHAVQWLLQRIDYGERAINNRLLQCARLGQLGLLKLLHLHGADLGYCEHAAMRYALKQGNTAMVAFLKAQGVPDL